MYNFQKNGKSTKKYKEKRSIESKSTITKREEIIASICSGVITSGVITSEVIISEVIRSVEPLELCAIRYSRKVIHSRHKNIK